MLDRFLFYITYVFYATAVMVTLFIFYGPELLYGNKLTCVVGVAVIYLGIYCIFHTQIKDAYSKSLSSFIAHFIGAFGLIIFSFLLLFLNPTPLTNYMTVRTTDESVYILSDKIYHKESFVPNLLKRTESRYSSYIERYNYSPRTAMLYGATPSYDLLSESIDKNPIKFGFLVTCEAFAYYAIMLSPLIICCAYYEEKKDKPRPNYSAKDLRIYSILLLPFILGLSPLLNVINPAP